MTTESESIVGVFIDKRPELNLLVYKRLVDVVRGSEAGSRMESERQLAKRFGVSRPTVRVALRRLRDEELIEKKQGKGNFVTRHAAAKRAVLLFFSDTIPPEGVYGRCLEGIRNALCQQAHRLTVIVNPDRGSLPGPPLESLPDEEIAAAVTLGIMDPGYIRRLAELVGRVITVDFEIPDANTDAVVFDSFGAGWMSADRLLSLKHQRIALIGGFRGSDVSGRKPEADSLKFKAGFMYAIQLAGNESTTDARPEFSIGDRDAAFAFGMDCLSKKDHPTAVACFDVSHAEGIRDAALRLGLNVPGDISVLVFGSENPAGGVSRFAVSADELGRRAGQVLTSRLDGDGSGRMRIGIPATFMDFGSVGEAP